MGAYESVVFQNKKRHWNKPLSDIFTSVKISENFPYSIKYLSQIRSISLQEKTKEPFYFLITGNNEVHALYYNTAKSAHSIKFEENISNVCQILPYAYIITFESGRIKMITNYIDKFETKSFDVHDVYFVIPCDSFSFITIGKDFETQKVDIDSGAISCIIPKNDEAESPPIDAYVLNTDPNIVVILASNSLIVASLGTHDVKTYKFEDRMAKISVIQPNTIFLLDESGEKLFCIKLDQDGKLVPNGNLNQDIFMIQLPNKVKIMQTKNTLFQKANQNNKRNQNQTPMYVYLTTSNSVSVIDTNFMIYKCLIPRGKNITHLLQIQSTPPNMIAIACDDGSVILMRIVQDGHDSIKCIDVYELENFHNCQIKQIESTYELMFLTIDEKGRFVTWESFPDWWAAPYYFEMFNGELDEEEDQEENMF